MASATDNIDEIFSRPIIVTAAFFDRRLAVLGAGEIDPVDLPLFYAQAATAKMSRWRQVALTQKGLRFEM
jgi:hypothetical protein